MKTTLNYTQEMLDFKEQFGLSWTSMCRLGMLYLTNVKLPMENLYKEVEKHKEDFDIEIRVLRKRIASLEQEVFVGEE